MLFLLCVLLGTCPDILLVSYALLLLLPLLLLLLLRPGAHASRRAAGQC
jgi:hypothetical protein